MMKKRVFHIITRLIIGGIILVTCFPLSNVKGMPLGVEINPTTFYDEDNDVAPCSLREAIESALYDEDRGGCTHTGSWSTSSYDNDVIQLAHGTYELTLGRLELYGTLMPSSHRSTSLGPLAGGFDIVIQGATDGSTIDGNGDSKVFILSSIAVSMDSILITGGYAGADDSSGGGIAIFNSSLRMDTCVVYANTAVQNGIGAGIANFGSLTMNEVLFMNNFIEPASGASNGGGGGALYNNEEVFATDVYFTGNHTGNNTGTGMSGGGGAIYNDYLGTIQLNRVTVSNNWTGDAAANATGNGGGIFNGNEMTVYTSTISGNSTGDVGSGDHYAGSGAGIYTFDTITIRDTTIADNDCGSGSGSGGCNGGGIQAFGVVTVGNSIIADNTATQGPDCIGSLISNDYLLLENSTCSLSGTTTHNIIGQDPLLGPLTDAGGTGWMHPLRLGSPAIDTGPNTCISPDQRHLSRAKDGDGDGTATCDIGAYEAYIWLFSPMILKP
jgi:CSLREA domain-containing protein